MMYEDRLPLVPGRETQGLEQGDVLRGVLTPEHATGASLGIRRGSSWVWQKPQHPADEILKEERKGPGHGVRAMVKVPRSGDCVVLSNSCDNSAGHYPIILAPVHPFEFDSLPTEALRSQLGLLLGTLAPRCSGRTGCEGFAVKLNADGVLLCDDCAIPDSTSQDTPQAEAIRAAIAETSTPAKRQRQQRADEWLQVSRAATGHSKTFYMPAAPASDFGRSEADLTEMFAVEPEYLARCLGELNAKRLFGLTAEAIRHLQRSVDFVFGRHPRDDHAWPSDEDFALKLEWLDLEIEQGSGRQAEYEQERVLIRRRLGITGDPSHRSG